jgi:hypothetical protein
MALSTPDASLKAHSFALLLAVSLLWSTLFLLTDIAYSTQSSEVGFAVTVVPSSVVVRVGEKARINVTATSAGAAPIGRVCFSLQGFPDSGLRATFLPECATSQSNRITATLTVEVTAAAAPQSFTALVIARGEGQTTQTTLDVTVEPAFPPWITWIGLLLFLLIFAMAITRKPKLPIRGIRHLFGRVGFKTGRRNLECTDRFVCIDVCNG